MIENSTDRSRPEFDVQQAHRYFAVHCFNSAWELLDKSDRSVADNEQVIRLAHASLWHWTQRADCAPAHLSIGYWQVARVYAVLEQADNARRFAERCLELTPGDQPFLLGYAYEALARAAAVAGNERKKREYLDEARRQAARIGDEDERALLVQDLDDLA